MSRHYIPSAKIKLCSSLHAFLEGLGKFSFYLLFEFAICRSLAAVLEEHNRVCGINTSTFCSLISCFSHQSPIHINENIIGCQDNKCQHWFISCAFLCLFIPLGVHMQVEKMLKLLCHQLSAIQINPSQ